MPKQIVFLSHSLSENSPAYGGAKGMKIEICKAIHHGDSCNQQKWTIDNHSGTHLDVPLHFFEGTSSVDQFDAAFWIFGKVGLCQVDAVADQIISTDDLDLNQISSEVELLLIKTQFESKRGEPLYWSNNPGLHPDLALTLRRQFPKLRAVGFDFISLTSYQNRALGREAHKAFLTPDAPLILVEDMKLSDLAKAPGEVTICPLRVRGADGAPCTIIARI